MCFSGCFQVSERAQDRLLKCIAWWSSWHFSGVGGGGGAEHEEEEEEEE